jgi:hypothetical protein
MSGSECNLKAAERVRIPLGGGTQMKHLHLQEIQGAWLVPETPMLCSRMPLHSTADSGAMGGFLVFWVVSVVVSVGGVLGGVLFVLICRSGVKCLRFG